MVRSMTAAGLVPHFHLMDELVLTRLVDLRAALKGDPAMAGGRLTFLPFFMKARMASCLLPCTAESVDRQWQPHRSSLISWLGCDLLLHTCGRSGAFTAGTSTAGPTALPIVLHRVQAVSVALREYPGVNASLAADGEALMLHGDHNLGVAVDTAAGLVVPNVKRVQQRSIPEIGAELVRLQVRQRLRPKKDVMCRGSAAKRA